MPSPSPLPSRLTPPTMAQPQSPRLDSALSFSHQADPAAYEDNDVRDGGCASSDDSDFEFAFAPPLGPAGAGMPDDVALADHLFAHGRILPAYPIFDRGLPQPAAALTAPPSPDTYCAWAPSSAPGSPTQDPAFPKSASTGQARRWRLRDLVGAGGRSHSDGKDKFFFLQPAAATEPTAPTTAAAHDGKKQSKKPPPPQKQSTTAAKKGKPVTEMDMATAHKLFYGKAGAAAAGDRKHHHQQASYLPYRPGIVGFFATAHALRRSHHPY